MHFPRAAALLLIVAIHRRSKWNMLAPVFNALEGGLNVITGARGKAKKSWHLNGNYGPVREEVTDKDLAVEGSLPYDLNGEYVRNGPNPHFDPKAGHHWFDGDGMLHGVRIKDGKVSYVNRYVRTQRFATEEGAGGPVYPTFGDFAGFSALLRMPITGLKRLLGVIPGGSEGTGNTALVFHGKTLLALHEGDVPYAVRILMDGELETLGLQSYGGKLKHFMTAHPKVDAKTGELFFFGYNMNKAPYVQYGVASKDAELEFCAVPITIDKPVMMHDFAITKRFSIFMDLPLVFEPKVMVKEGKLPFLFDKTRPARFGLLPRHARDEKEIMWFTLKEACYIFHTANAWEEGDDIVKLVACPSPKVELNMDGYFTPPSVVEYTFHLASGEVTERRLTETRMDFPRVNDALTGHRSRFVYGAVFGTEGRTPLIDGIVKLDVDKEGEDASEVGKIIYGDKRHGGEAVFVPRSNASSEDDGFLLVFVHDGNTGKSEFAVYDAKTMAPEPVARVVLPHRVPYGFHGLFVSEEQIQSQGLPADGSKAIELPPGVVAK